MLFDFHARTRTENVMSRDNKKNVNKITSPLRSIQHVDEERHSPGTDECQDIEDRSFIVVS